MLWAALFGIAGLVFGLFAGVAPRPNQGVETQEFEKPVADENEPVAWAFGTVTVQKPNVIFFGGLSMKAVKSKGGKK
jgi:hypothetical protein